LKHPVHFTLYVLLQHESQPSLHCTHCDSVSTFIHAKKIILWCCMLPTHTSRPRRLGASHQNRIHLPSLCILHHTLYTSLFMFYTMHWNMIARITSMKTIVSLYTPPCYKHLLLMQARCVHKMGKFSFHCGWMEILELLHSWKEYITHHCIYQTLHFTSYLPKSTSPDVNRTFI
jgi:hypothetical protein